MLEDSAPREVHVVDHVERPDQRIARRVGPAVDGDHQRLLRAVDAGAQNMGDFDAKRDRIADVFADFLAVDVDARAAVYAADFKPHPPAMPFVGNRERSAIPTDADRVVAHLVGRGADALCIPAAGNIQRAIIGNLLRVPALARAAIIGREAKILPAVERNRGAIAGESARRGGHR